MPVARYFLELTMQQADGAAFEQAQTTLLNRLNRLEETATRSAENGVEATELEQIITEARELAQRAQDAADKIKEQ
ncbi:hypothetical protein [Nocardia sp. NBC_00403]|uniref:hypothetical protein n=1 Tax=Nocardia sp. NBC_00403 TaxID=2975990 RepID=UPI002E1C2F56